MQVKLIRVIPLDSVSASIPETVSFMFQMTFAIITPALIIGAFAERMKFSAVLLFSALWLILVYIPVCHYIKRVLQIDDALDVFSVHMG